MALQILSRDAFTQVLGAAQRHVLTLDPRWPLRAQVASQLEFMAATTDEGRVPHEDERTRTSLGPLAARNLEESDPAFADQLQQLGYTFHRYPLLPKGPPVKRRGILQVWSGRESFRKLILSIDAPRSVGTAHADLLVHPDPAGAALFQIHWDGLVAHVQAHDPHRLTINGEPAWTGELANRGWMTAGSTTYRFFVEDRTPPPVPVAPTPASTAALAELSRRCDTGHLYAVIDAARSERALQLVEESIDPYASLYDGEPGRAFDDVAPYLVHLQRDSWLLERFVTEGWGDAWGIFLLSSANFDAVRRHLRQFLMVEVDGEAHRLFFRFYDPRVLKTFAEVITPEQRAELLQDLDALLYEAEDTLRTLSR